MSEQTIPDQVLDDEVGNTATDASAQEDAQNAGAETVENTESGEDEGNREPHKVSRFQRFKAEQEAIVREKERELAYWRNMALDSTGKTPTMASAAAVDEEPTPVYNKLPVVAAVNRFMYLAYDRHATVGKNILASIKQK